MIGQENRQGHLMQGWMEIDNKTGKFLESLKALLDWDGLHSILESLYNSQMGRPGYAPEVLFRMWLLERIYNVSDVRLVEEVKDRVSFREFVGIPWGEKVPDDTTMVKFRKRIIEGKKEDALWGWFEAQLTRHGLNLKKGSVVIVDATLVSSHHKRGAENGEGKPLEPEAQTGKRGPLKIVHGYNVCMGYDLENQMGMRPVVASGNIHDVHLFPKALTGKEGTVTADCGFDARLNRRVLREGGMKDGIMHQPRRKKVLSPKEQKHNLRWKKVRSRIESFFGCLKQWRGLRKLRVAGMVRVKQFIEMTVMAENLVRMVKRKAVVAL